MSVSADFMMMEELRTILLKETLTRVMTIAKTSMTTNSSTSV